MGGIKPSKQPQAPAKSREEMMTLDGQEVLWGGGGGGGG